MKKLTDQELLVRYRLDVVQELLNWKHIEKDGCNDPFWPDGCNMNLVRNHILNDKRKILELCEKLNTELPEEYYIPIPPEVSNGYMANLKQKKRLANLIDYHHDLTLKKTKFNDIQTELF